MDKNNWRWERTYVNDRNWWWWVKKHWLKILLFIFIWVIITAGFYQFLFFLPDNTEVFSKKLTFSLIAGLGLTGLGFYVYFVQKEKLNILKAALQVLRYLDPEGLGYSIFNRGFPKLRHNSIYKFEPNKDLTLGVTLEELGILYYFNKYDLSELAKILDQLDEGQQLHEILCKLDQFILDNLENFIKQNYPEQMYILRYNVLHNFCNALEQGKFIAYNQEDKLCTEESRVIRQFCNAVLHDFCVHHKQHLKFDGYHIPLHMPDSNSLREAFSKSDKWSWRDEEKDAEIEAAALQFRQEWWGLPSE